MLLPLAFSAALCAGDQLFVGIMEADSFRSLEMSVTAFAEVSRFPQMKDAFRRTCRELTALPELNGFEQDKRVRIIQTIDPAVPLGDTNPAWLAILPIRDGGTAIESMLAESYGNSTYWRANISIYDKPASTNLFPQVAVVQEGMYMLTSRSKEALFWACENRKLLDAPPLTQKGSVRMLMNPQRFGAILGAKGDSRVLDFLKPVEILQELDSCTMAVLMDAQSLTFTAQVRPLEGGPLAVIMKNLTKPDTSLLDSAPSGSFLQSISRCNDPATWNRFTLNLQCQALPALTALNNGALFPGERAQYLAGTADGKGLIFAQFDTVKDISSVMETIRALDGQTRGESGIFLEKEAAAQESKTVRYKVGTKKDESQENQSAFHSIASLFLQHAWLEMQVEGNRLITVLGPRGSMTEVLNAMNAEKSGISLLREIHARNTNAGGNLMSGMKLQLSGAFRHIASILPHVTKEQLAALPAPGYGITFCLGQPDDRSLNASLQISADEVHALSRIGNDSRELMQKVLVAMLMERIEKASTNQDKRPGE